MGQGWPEQSWCDWTEGAGLVKSPLLQDHSTTPACRTSQCSHSGLSCLNATAEVQGACGPAVARALPGHPCEWSLEAPAGHTQAVTQHPVTAIPLVTLLPSPLGAVLSPDHTFFSLPFLSPPPSFLRVCAAHSKLFFLTFSVTHTCTHMHTHALPVALTLMLSWLHTSQTCHL